MSIKRSLQATLTQLQDVLSELSNEEYGKPLEILSNASIGQHTRHIIEFFQTLTESYDAGIVNCELAQRELSTIMDAISRKDKELLLVGTYASDTAEEFSVRSTYYRELIYNLEHAVHHMAMIKIGIRASTHVKVPADFGVASATILYKKSIL